MTTLADTTSTETIAPAIVRSRLAIVPDWIEKVLAAAEKAGKHVNYTFACTPFGRYPMSIEVA